MLPNKWPSATIALALTLTACSDKPLLPLAAPLTVEHTVAGAVRVVLVDGDLASLAETIRVKAGKTVEIAAAPWPLPGASGQTLGALAGSISSSPGTAVWTDDRHLRLTYPMGKQAVPLSIGAPGGAACAFSWSASAGSLAIELEVRRSAQGLATASLASEPSTVWQQAQFIDAETCLAQVNPSAPAQVRAHVESEVRAALVSRFAGAALHALNAVFAPGLERDGRVTAPTRWGDAIETRISIEYKQLSAQDPAAIARHEGVHAWAELSLGLEVDRAACAMDLPPPKIASTPLPPQAPVAPGASAFLRRAIVIDRSAIAHVAWAMARSGALCQETPTSAPIEAAWAGAAVPALGEWIEGGPTGARFWPGGSDAPHFVDSADGPTIEWGLSNATLEIVGRVAGTEMVVLSISGHFRVLVGPVVASGTGLGLVFLSASRDATIVSSPLFGDDLKFTDAAVDSLVDAALRGIFSTLPVLPLSAALPADTVVTGVSRSADALWLWLEGGMAE